VHPLIVSRDRMGNVSIVSADSNAKILYNVTPMGMKVQRGRSRKMKETAYAGPFNLIDGGKVVAWDAAAPEFAVAVDFPRIESIPVEVIACSSEMSGESASNLTDGDPSTIWHTVYGVTQAIYPHWIVFDCLAEKPVKGFTYLPRRSGNNGDIKDWKLEVSSDNSNWTDVAKGTFENNKQLKRVEFTPVKARYVRFTGLSSQNGQDFGSGAEFGILVD